MHIVFLNVTGNLGGAERVLLTLLRELRRLRPEFTLTVIAGDSGPLLGSVRALGCHAELLPLPEQLKALGDWNAGGRLNIAWQLAVNLPKVLRYRALLRRRLRALRPDVVQTNGFKMHVLGALACTTTAKLIWHIHDFVSNRVVMKTLLRRFSAHPDMIVAISETVASDVRLTVRAPANVRTILNSVDLSRPAVFAATNGPLRIGLVATFAKWKGHRDFLAALALLPKNLNWQGFIVGAEVYARAASQYTESELRNMVAELGLTEKLEFTGFLADPAPFLETLDIVVHASTQPEPFGLVIAEGMAAGRAVVTSSDSIVTHGENGFVFGMRDAAVLAQALETLARDPALRQRLGQAARQTAEQKFQPERMAQQFLDLYEARA